MDTGLERLLLYIPFFSGGLGKLLEGSSELDDSLCGDPLMYATFVAPVHQYSTETEPSRQASFNYPSSRQPSFKQNSSEAAEPPAAGTAAYSGSVEAAVAAPELGQQELPKFAR